MSTGTVFPVGHYCGTSLPDSRSAADRTVSAENDHLVRVGRSLERLTDDEFGVWMLAHGLPDVGRRDWTTDDILDRAGDAEITNPAGCVDELLGRGLLAFVPTEPERVDESVAFAAEYRAAPLLVGLGAAPDRPDQHAIGVPGVGTAAMLDTGCYELWRQSAVAPSLWRLCQDRVSRASRAGAVDSGLDGMVDPTRLLADLLGELRVLIVHGCAYLDVLPADGENGDEARPGASDGTRENGTPGLGNVAE